MDVSDRLAILDLVARYAHMVDARRWDDMSEIYTEDVVFDARDVGLEVARGIPAVRQFVEGVAAPGSDWEMPLSHHTTNVLITEQDDRRARVESKWLVVRPSRVTSGSYVDEAVLTDSGWRLSARVVQAARPFDDS